MFFGPKVQHRKRCIRKHKTQGAGNQHSCRCTAERRSRNEAADAKGAGLHHHRNEDAHIEKSRDFRLAGINLQTMGAHQADNDDRRNAQAFIEIENPAPGKVFCSAVQKATT